MVMQPKDRRKISLIALVLGLAVAVLPWVFFSGTAINADRWLASGQLFVAAGVIFLGGFLTSLTPCVYPLIPITVGVFGARKSEGRAKSVLLTSAYVVGMGVVFAALGVAAALSGKAFGGVLGDRRVLLGLAAFLLLLALSMFGAFELALPPALAQKLGTVGGAGLGGAFLMGSASGFLAAPCTGPVLSGLLAFVAKSQRPVLGGALLFIYALGIGVPFFLIGVFTLRLPKGGEWMEWVKSFFGVTLVALSASYTLDAIPAAKEVVRQLGEELGRVPGAWIAAGLTAVGVLLGAIHLSFKASARDAALKGLAVAVMVFAVLLRIGALNVPPAGALWGRLGLGAGAGQQLELAWHYRFPNAPSAQLASFDEQLSQAHAQGRPVMIDFFADWCAACKELDREVYVSPRVIAEAGRFTSIKVDGTNPDELIDTLYERFGVQGLPTVAFVSSDGKVLEEPRVTGFVEPEAFLAQLRKVR